MARRKIDAGLRAAGWAVLDRDGMNVYAARGVAVREFALAPGHGIVDYLLFVDGQPVGVLEAKPMGHTLSGVEVQAQKYATGLRPAWSPPVRPLPFIYLSTGAITKFANLLDPHPRSRRVFNVHRPETLAEWLAADTLDAWVKAHGTYTAADDTKPSTLRARLRAMPKVDLPNLWPNKVEAIAKLEKSLFDDRPRALVQMATGSGKTKLAVTSIYRLIKFGGARRVVFLVDRSNLAEQAEKEFQSYRTPDDNRKFTDLYNVQRLTSNTIAASAKVVITTIQRLYSMLKGEPELDPEAEDDSHFHRDGAGSQGKQDPLPVVYNDAIPPEFFDVVFVDECHRSIYTLWRQVLEYFDAYLIGLTATPAAHTFGFFDQNLVMEYRHARAVADDVNVDFEVYRICTRITEDGSTIDASPLPILGVRERQTREVRWQAPDNPVTYEGKDLDRSVVARDQIRLIVRTFQNRLFSEIFPGRTEVPKTIIFAKDDSHAEDIVEIVREEFGRGNELCQKITYKTTGKKPAELIQDFRNSYYPRIVVTVDLIATGTDIKPVEVVMFMRSVRSRVLFEQMKGRGVRVIDRDELRAVSPDAHAKTHFVIVDCVGVTESELSETCPLDRNRAVPFKTLLQHAAEAGTDPTRLASLAGRLARLHRQCDPQDHDRIRASTGGLDLTSLSAAIVDALDPDRQIERAREVYQLPEGQAPSEEQIEEVARSLATEAVKPIASNPGLRTMLLELKKQYDQLIDEVSQDALLYAGASDEAKERAKELTESFAAYLAEHKDEICALQFFFSQPYQQRLRFADVKALAAAIQAPPRAWTPALLWRAYEVLDRDKVRGASARRLLTDLVSLVRFALHREDELVPYGDRVRERFEQWLGQQRNLGRTFTPAQLRWLALIRDHVATSVEITPDDFDYAPFAEEGGLGKATQVFGGELRPLLDELNEALAA